MTIEQLIQKLKVATDIPWSYDQVGDATLNVIGMGDKTAYRLIANNNVNSSVPTIVTKEFMAPIAPESFEAKDLVDGIIGNLQYENIDLVEVLTKQK